MYDIFNNTWKMDISFERSIASMTILKASFRRAIFFHIINDIYAITHQLYFVMMCIVRSVKINHEDQILFEICIL